MKLLSKCVSIGGINVLLFLYLELVLVFSNVKQQGGYQFL